MLTSDGSIQTSTKTHRLIKSKAMRLVLVGMGIVLVAVGLILVVQTFKQQLLSLIPGQKVNQPNNQTVAPPTRIVIPSINVDAPIENLGLNVDGTLQVPTKWEDVGWYTGSTSPGLVGPSVLVGHLDSFTGPAVFWNLHKLKTGDMIQIFRADGSSVTYRVDNSQSFSQNNFPTNEVYGAIGSAGLRLITCSGTYSAVLGHYSNNLVVFGTLVQ